LTRLPGEVPGLFADLQTEHVDPGLVPGIVAVSTVSLIGGASLGPEKATGSMGGGAGSWIAQRRALAKEDSQVNTLAGFAGAYGGMFSSTVIVMLLILEVARPGGQRLTKALAAEIVASSVSFGIYSASTSPSPARCSWTTTRCRSTSSRTGSYSPGSPWACSRPWW
jgi:H+/Cl- antiporter ClcA